MEYNRRLLIVDDNKAIHEDFLKVLSQKKNLEAIELDNLERELFGDDNEASGFHDKWLSQIDYEIDSAFQGEEALDKVRQAAQEQCPYALIYMDVRMPPGWDGIETIQRIWYEFPYIEMVICTAYSDYSWDEIIRKLGLNDKLLFLKKPFDSVAVKQMALTLVKKWNLDYQGRCHVTSLEKQVSERTEQLKALLKELEVKNIELACSNKELEHVANHDGLTQLPNRVLFHDRLAHGIKIANRNRLNFAVALLDLNKFKEINDALGHDAGDEVLKQVSSRLTRILRACDTIARLGGDEFAIILPSLEVECIDVVANKIEKSLEQPIALGERQESIGVSIGFSLYPMHGDTSDKLLKCADLAMYQAKRSKQKYVLFDENAEDVRFNKLKLLLDLENVVKNGGLSLNYQPIIELDSGKVVGAEALARWYDPTRGFVPPDKFIPLAEKRNLIHSLTAWVLDAAIGQCVLWHRTGYEISVSINLSARNLLDTQLPEKIEKILKKWQLDAKWVKLEVTEGMTISDLEQGKDILTRLSVMGLKISIDDFGTGYSSLVYLKKLPVNELKIDRSFVCDVNSDKDNKTIVQSTIDMAHNLGLSVVAEGVEDEMALQTLKSLGCDKVQGYYICHPQPEREFQSWLSSVYLK